MSAKKAAGVGRASSYPCRHPGCAKEFTRKDHLLRHAANHEAPQWFCDGCRRGFKRLDLLHRHMNRNICQHGGILPLDPRSDISMDYSSSTYPAGSSGSDDSPISPRVATNGHDPDARVRQSLARDLDGATLPLALDDGERMSTTMGAVEAWNRSNGYMARYDGNTSAVTSAVRGGIDSPRLPHEASPVQHHYHYQSHFNQSTTAASSSNTAFPSPAQNPLQGFHFPPPTPAMNGPTILTSTSPTPNPFVSPILTSAPSLPSGPSAPPSAFASHFAFHSTSNNYDLDMACIGQWGQNDIRPEAWDPLPVMTMEATPTEPFFAHRLAPIPDSTAHDHLRTSFVPSVPRLCERTPSTNDVDATVLDTINMTFPQLDMSLDQLRCAVSRYWTDIAPSFPFVHRATFDPAANPDPYLVVMMAISGTTQYPHPRRDYHPIVRQIRGALVQQCGIDMSLSILQAFCLCHAYDTWFGTPDSLFQAQCTWPVMVAHSRKKGIGVQDAARHTPRRDMDDQAEEIDMRWRAWVEDEEKRRAAFCVLMVDTQISGFWNQHPSRQLSIFAHHIGLPCSKSEWEAASAEEWLDAVSLRQANDRRPSTTGAIETDNPAFAPGPHAPGTVSPPTQTIPRTGRRSSCQPTLYPIFQVSAIADGYSKSVLAAMAAEAMLPFPVDMNHSLSVGMILMGCCAAAWDFRTRGGMGFKLQTENQDWRRIVLHAVVNLRATWEGSIQRCPPSVETRDMRDAFALSIISALSDIPMLQVAAGATLICGTSIGSRDHRDAQRRLRLWATSRDAFECLWQSARYLRGALWADWGLYSSWAVYLATLVLWAHAWVKTANHEDLGGAASPSDIDRSASAESLLQLVLASTDSPAEMRGISDLVHVAADRVRARRARIDLDSARLLFALVGGRVGGEGA